MDVNVTTKDLWKMLVITWVVLAMVIGVFGYLHVRHIASLRISAVGNTLTTYDQNFTVIKQAIDSMSAAINELKLTNQIKGNILESGELDDKGQPIKK